MTSENGDEFPVTKVYISKHVDLAVVCTDKPLKLRVAIIKKDMPAPYSAVFAVGNPLGFRNIVTGGLYQGDNMFSAPIAWGNSGGGVFEANGALIGLVTAAAIKRIENHVFLFPHLAFMTTATDIIPFLEEQKIDYAGV
jgi:S1-C subfamily serine protease